MTVVIKLLTMKAQLQSRSGETLKIKNKIIVTSIRQSIFNGGS